MDKKQSPPPSEPRRAPLALKLLRAAFGALTRVAPALAARGAHYLWYRPQRHAPSAREFALLSRARCLPLTYQDRPVAAYAWGQGPRVLLVHGWSGRAAQLGEFVSPLVTAGFQVVAFDAPAHGRTPGRSTTLPDIAHVIALIARTLGPVHAIIAHSFGVLCALYALSREASVERFVGISPPASVEGLLETFASRLGLSRGAIERLCRLLEQRFGETIWSEFSTTQIVARLKLAGFIIHDRLDREIPWHEGAAVADAWPGAALLLTQGLGHRRLLRDPEVVRAAVQFIEAR